MGLLDLLCGCSGSLLVVTVDCGLCLVFASYCWLALRVLTFYGCDFSVSF